MANLIDPVRKFLWSIGNGTSEASLCSTLQQFYHTTCTLSDLFDKEICIDYKHAYVARCSESSHRLTQEGTFLYIALVLIFCLSTASLLKAKKILFIPDSAVTILVGLITGSIFEVSRKGQHKFNEQVFFEILLPFIIFESGYNMDKKLLKKNFGRIMMLATLGTLINFGVITGLMYGLSGAFGSELTLLDSAMFGSLISSTDPVAIINVFSSLGVDARLYALVVGESTLNDGVAVALYSSMKYFYFHPNIEDSEAFQHILVNFISIGFGSILLGLAFGLFTAYLWKKQGTKIFRNAVLETLVFLIFAFLPYYVADALKWSGVISIVSASITLSIYAHHNLSPTAQFHVVFLVECCARLFEAVMFGYLGTQMIVNNERMVWNGLVILALFSVLLARAASTYPLLSFSNLISRLCKRNPQEQVGLNYQIIVWFSGLRGALAFALAVTVPEYDTVTKQGSKHTGELLACTCFIIVLNVFIMGGFAPFVLKSLTRTKPIALENADNNNQAKINRGWLSRLHTQILLPTFTRQESIEANIENEAELSNQDIIPDENGFIHIAFDDDDEFDSSTAVFKFPRSRVALKRPSVMQTDNLSPIVSNQQTQPNNTLTHALLQQGDE